MVSSSSSTSRRGRFYTSTSNSAFFAASACRRYKGKKLWDHNNSLWSLFYD
ncbi:MAG: hypothetical protein RL326_934 [Pseudomonadota bacterium]|jgi:hypothetical protein